MTLSNPFSCLFPVHRNRSEVAASDRVAAALSAPHNASSPDAIDDLEASLRANPTRTRATGWLARARAALRRPTIVMQMTLQIPDGVARAAALPASARATPAKIAQLAYALYGDDADHRNAFAYSVLQGFTTGGDPVLSEQDFSDVKRVVDRVWDKNHLRDTQRALLSVACDRDTVAHLLENPLLMAALHKLGQLHAAAQNRWSERFLRAILGNRPEQASTPTRAVLPENLALAMRTLFLCQPERQAALQSLCTQELSAADMAALQALGETDLGRKFLLCARRSASYIEEHPQVIKRALENAQRVAGAVTSDYALQVAMDAGAAVLSIRRSVRDVQHREAQSFSTQTQAKSVTAFADALRNAHVQKLLDPQDIETMSAETFMALPGWVILASLQSLLHKRTNPLILDAIAEKVFHREAAKPSVEHLLAYLNAMESPEIRSATVAEASRLLTAINLENATPAVAAVLAATKRVGSEMLSNDRQLFAELCAKAYEVFGASLK